MEIKKDQKTYAFIDASNLCYGGKKSLGWMIDHQKLFKYLQNKYNVSRFLYFGGIEVHDYEYDYLKNETVDVSLVKAYLEEYIKINGKQIIDTELILFNISIKKANFYLKLKQFGFELWLKPVKKYPQDDGSEKSKSNCDVDMAFLLMREKEKFDNAIIISGDGDFLPVLKYLRKEGKNITILARGGRAAKEIKQFAKDNFRDFEYLKYILQREVKKE